MLSASAVQAVCPGTAGGCEGVSKQIRLDAFAPAPPRCLPCLRWLRRPTATGADESSAYWPEVFANG